ncbi:MAG: AzlC family ABC transporter permease [Chloroflexota bacterium]
MTILFPTPKAAFWQGVQTIAPILFGVAPFGLVVGVFAGGIELTVGQTIGQAMLVYAGAAQLVMLDLFDQGAAIWVIILSTAMLNLRYVIYSASIAPYYKPLSPLWRLLLALVMVDQVYAFCQALFSEHPETTHKQWYHLGLAIPIAIVWFIATLVGYYLGAVIPESWSLNFVVPLMFLAFVVPAIKDWSYFAAAVTAAFVAVATTDLPNNLGLIAATLAGITVGFVLGGQE